MFDLRVFLVWLEASLLWLYYFWSTEKFATRENHSSQPLICTTSQYTYSQTDDDSDSDDLLSEYPSPIDSSPPSNVIGIHQLDETRRYIAIKYSAEEYHSKYLSESSWKPKRSFPNCHKFDTPTPQGTPQELKAFLGNRGSRLDREKFFLDLRLNAAPLTEHERIEIESCFKSGAPLDTLPVGRVQDVAYGFKYDVGNLNNNHETDPSFYGRGPYYAAAHSTDGVITGRIDWQKGTLSTPTRPIIDRETRKNFGTFKKPIEQFDTSQQGVLTLVPPGERHPQCADPIWTVPYNDTFYLGAIHFHIPILLASKRIHDEVWRKGDEKTLTVFGRETAEIRGSEAYDLHISKSLGETFIYAGAPRGKQYYAGEAIAAIKKFSEVPAYRESLTWLHSIGETLEEGEMIVQELQILNGKWVGIREANALQPDEL